MTKLRTMQPTSGILADVASLPLFSKFGDLQLLLQFSRVEDGGDGVVLFEEGDPAESFHVILDGHVEVFLRERERVTVIDVLRRPALIGETGLFVAGGHGHAARVAGYARLLTVPNAPFLALLSDRFDLMQRMLGAMSVRLRGLIAQIGELKLKSTAQRLAGFLLGLAKVESGPARVRFPYDKRLAASTLGMTAESLSRALARLSPLGVRSLAENLVVIEDIDVLRNFCVEEDAP